MPTRMVFADERSDSTREQNIGTAVLGKPCVPPVLFGCTPGTEKAISAESAESAEPGTNEGKDGAAALNNCCAYLRSTEACSPMSTAVLVIKYEKVVHVDECTSDYPKRSPIA